MTAKLTSLTHEIAIQLHLVAESCTICRSRSRRPVRKLLDTPSYEHPPPKKKLPLFPWSLILCPTLLQPDSEWSRWKRTVNGREQPVLSRGTEENRENISTTRKQTSVPFLRPTVYGFWVLFSVLFLYRDVHHLITMDCRAVGVCNLQLL
jgi:hypothetical protein